ncbi:MAG: response regulator, partial [Acidobacteriota bacterium]
METILIVDDERVIREGCRRIFEAEGYRVITAESGPKALEVLELERGVDVVFCDLKMPGMSAIDVLGAVTTRYPDLPLIVITGHGTVDNAVECMKSGAYDFVTKPFQVDHLVLVARRALEKRALEHRARELQEAQAKSLYDLAMEQSRIHAIVNCMADGVLVTNRNLEVVFCNSALKRLLELRDPVALPGSLDDYGVDASLAGVL